MKLLQPASLFLRGFSSPLSCCVGVHGCVWWPTRQALPKPFTPLTRLSVLFTPSSPSLPPTPVRGLYIARGLFAGPYPADGIEFPVLRPHSASLYRASAEFLRPHLTFPFGSLTFPAAAAMVVVALLPSSLCHIGLHVFLCAQTSTASTTYAGSDCGCLCSKRVSR